ncbi:MAG: DUF7336 domain-containing protein [Terriglobia bacterium]
MADADKVAEVFLVQHIHVHEDGEEDVKVIGIYSSRENALKATERLKLQPGFRDTPNDFYIDPYGLDEDNWTDGFMTIRHTPDEP